MGRRTAASVSSKPLTPSPSSEVSPPPVESIAPPRRRYRDSVSVLRALSSCVPANLALPDYGRALEPWFSGPQPRERVWVLALASGRKAARHLARNLLANDLSALATEVGVSPYLFVYLFYFLFFSDTTNRSIHASSNRGIDYEGVYRWCHLTRGSHGAPSAPPLAQTRLESLQRCCQCGESGGAFKGLHNLHLTSFFSYFFSNI